MLIEAKGHVPMLDIKTKAQHNMLLLHHKTENILQLVICSDVFQFSTKIFSEAILHKGIYSYTVQK